MDFRTESVADLAAGVRSGRWSARELTDTALDRIAAFDGGLNAFVLVDDEGARRQADEVDTRLAAGEGVGPLAGVPLGVKDLEDAAGLPTRYGSLLSSDAPAEGDSVLVARLRAAGCVIVGKTTTPEYGHKGVTESPLTGATRNPWDLDRSPGGSSGGSGAAIAAGMVPLATGSDGGGSIRIPSALCGFSGIKTSQGRVPNGGPNPPGSGLFSVKGPMALRSTDLAFALDVCVGPHPSDPFSLPRSGAPWYDAVCASRLPVRVAWSPTMGFATVDDEMATVMAAAVEQLADAGVEIVEIDDVWPTPPIEAWLVSWAASRALAQGHLKGTDDWVQIDESLRPQIEYGLTATAVDLARAQAAAHHYNLQLERVFETAPFLLTPACAGLTPHIGEIGGTVNGVATPAWVEFTYGINATRNPAGVVRVGATADGLPVGLHIVGPHLADVSVLQTMAAFERLFGLEVPPGFGGAIVSASSDR
ncbi:MAG: amidase [Acidimicrobiales bacterium]